MLATASNLFEAVYDQAFLGGINYPADTINLILLTPSANPSLSGWSHYSDVTNEVPNGGGYVTGGVTLTNKTHMITSASGWGTAWTAANGQNVGDIVRPVVSNGYLYRCVVAGVTGSSASILNSGPTIQGGTIVDGSVTWSCIGDSVTAWSSDPANFTTASFSTAYAIICDMQSGNPATAPLISLIAFGQTLQPLNGIFTVTPNVNGWFVTTTA